MKNHRSTVDLEKKRHSLHRGTSLPRSHTVARVSFARGAESTTKDVTSDHFHHGASERRIVSSSVDGWDFLRCFRGEKVGSRRESRRFSNCQAKPCPCLEPCLSLMHSTLIRVPAPVDGGHLARSRTEAQLAQLFVVLARARCCSVSGASRAVAFLPHLSWDQFIDDDPCAEDGVPSFRKPSKLPERPARTRTPMEDGRWSMPPRE